MLCAKKFSFIIIFTALRDSAAAERPQHCALVYKVNRPRGGHFDPGDKKVIFRYRNASEKL